MLYVTDITDWKNDIFGCHGIKVMGMIGKLFDGQKGVIEGGMVHGTDPLTFLMSF